MLKSIFLMIFVMIVMTLIWTAPAFAQPDPSCVGYSELPSVIGTIEDHPSAFPLTATDDHLAIVYPYEDGVRWFSNPDTGDAEELGFYVRADHLFHCLAADGDLVFLGLREPDAPYDWVLEIVDFGNPAVPVLLSATHLPEPGLMIADIAVRDGLVYVAGSGQGLVIYDIGDPTTPSLAGRIMESEQVGTVALDGSTCWLTGFMDTDEGVVFVRAFDLTDPLAPILLGETTRISVWGYAWGFSDLVVENGRGAVAATLTTTDPMSGDHISYRVFTFSTADFPEITLETLPILTDRPCPIAMGEGILFVDQVRCLRAFPDAAVGDYSRFHICNSDEGGFHLTAGGGRAWQGTGGGAFGFGGDWQYPTASACRTPIGGDVKANLIIQDDLAFFINGTLGDPGEIGSMEGGGVAVYDISDPCAVTEVGSYLDDFGIPMELFVHGEYLYSRGRIVHWPTSTDLGESDLMGELFCDVNATTKYIYYNGGAGFFIYDFTDPTNPVLAGHGLENFSVQSLCYDGSMVYVLGQSVYVMAAVDPLHPQLATEIPLAFTGRHIAHQDGLLVISGYDGLQIIDITDLGNPQVLCHLPEVVGKRSVVSGHLVYHQSNPQGLQVFDITDPANPVFVGAGGTYGRPNSLQLRDDQLVYLDGDGLAFNRLECTDPLDIEILPDDPLPAPPARFALGEPYPNPFNPSVQISFSLERAGQAELEVYTLAGRRVRTLVSGSLAEGGHMEIWNGLDDHGRSVAAGVYFVRLAADDRIETRKIALVK